MRAVIESAWILAGFFFVLPWALLTGLGLVT